MPAYQRDSARVENRGPSITTIVPPRRTSMLAAAAVAHGRAAGRAVRVGEVHVHRAVVVERLDAPARAVDELVGQHECARPELGAQPPDGARREDLAYADRAQRPQVRPVGDAVRREPVILAVPGKESDRPAVDLGDRDRVGRSAVRRVDMVLARHRRGGVESGTTDDGDVGESGHATDSNRGAGSGYGASHDDRPSQVVLVAPGLRVDGGVFIRSGLAQWPEVTRGAPWSR